MELPNNSQIALNYTGICELEGGYNIHSGLMIMTNLVSYFPRAFSELGITIRNIRYALWVLNRARVQDSLQQQDAKTGCEGEDSKTGI